jgi:hypothetical protein
MKEAIPYLFSAGWVFPRQRRFHIAFAIRALRIL